MKVVGETGEGTCHEKAEPGSVYRQVFFIMRYSEWNIQYLKAMSVFAHMENSDEFYPE